MAKVRRRVLRSQRPVSAAESPLLERVQKKWEQLDKERAALGRWMARLKRSLNSVETLQAKIARIERDMAMPEQS